MSKTTEKTLMGLFWPVFLEYTFQMLVGVADTVMLSFVSDQAVAASGTSYTYLYLISMIFTIMSTGALTVMTQYIGAGKSAIAVRAKKIGIYFNFVIGLAFTLIFLSASRPILEALQTSPAVLPDAVSYMKIVGGSCVFLAVTNVYSSFLRAFGYAKYTFWSAGIGNVTNIILNGVFIWMGFGISGVASATFISRVINLVLVILFSAKVRRQLGELGNCDISDRKIFGQIFKIGFPSAGELIVFNLSISFMVRCLNLMDEEGIAAGVYSYCNQVCNLIYCTAVSFSQANGIIVGWRIGEKRFDEAYRQTMYSLKLGFVITLIIAVAAAFVTRPILGLLTDNQAILSCVIPVMAINIFKEIGRQGNYIVGTALKSSGDAAITVFMGICSMPTCAILGSYVLGLHFGLGVYGAWIGMACDECIRCLWMIARLRSRKWEKKALVSS